MSYLLAYNPYNTNLFMRTRSIDPAAQDFIDAAGITGDVQQQAINNLVKGLKADGIWSKMKAVYPFVTDNRNLLSYTDTFSNSYWQASSGGLKTPNYATAPDGTMTACRVYNGGYFQSQGISKSVGTYVFSFYVKMTSGTSGSIRVFLDGGTSTTTVNVTNTWTRVEIAKTFASTDVGTCGFFIDSDVLIWHPQLELGSTATTYQPIATTQQAYIASQFKYNLVNPVDSDAAFRLVFNGGWTHSSNGATPNGTNGYADTKLSPLSVLQLNDTSYSVYTNQYNLGYKMGIDDGGSSSWIRGFNSNNTQTTDHANNGAFTPLIFVEDKGFVLANRTSATTDSVFNNNVKYTRLNASSGRSARSYYIGAYNGAAGAAGYTNAQFRFSHMASGLTDDEAAALYYHTQVFQTSLNRQIGSPAYAIPVVTDPNAKLYLSAIGSTTNSTFNTAIDTFIKGLKADGIYSKMKAVYPFATDNVNLASYTEDFSNAFWSKYYCTITPNSITAPNGTLTADTLTQTSSDGRVEQTISTNSNQVTGSAYVKGSANSIGKLSTLYMWRDGGAEIITQSVILTAEWQRIILPVNFSVTPSTVMLRIDAIENGVTGDSAYIWGAQLQVGLTATTYQPQLGSAQSYFANQFKYNMINPQDDDSAFRLVFNGGWTHSPQGATPNGTNGYADTKLNDSSLTPNSSHMSYYSRTNALSSTYEIGIYNGTKGIWLGLKQASGTAFTGGIFQAGASGEVSVSNLDSTGYYIGGKNGSTTVKFYKNGTSVASTAKADTTATNTSIYLATLNQNGSPAFGFSTKQCAFSTIGDGLTDTEAANLFVRVETLNRALARQVVVPTVSDPDAQAFLINAVITDPTQATAINNLVVGLKADGLWDKMKAIYPFVGGTASTHKYNLKDPRDLDAAYRLVFSGGWTHDANGATPNGVNGYANTYLSPLSALSTSSAHLSYYSRTNVNQASYDLSAGQHYSLLLYQNTFYVNLETSGQYNATQVLTNTTGYYIGSRINNTNVNGYRNGIKTINNIAQNSTLSAQPLFLAATNSGQYFSSKQVAFTSIGDGLTDIDATNLYNRVNTYQVALSRNV
jgi:hypothetical protein